MNISEQGQSDTHQAQKPGERRKIIRDKNDVKGTKAESE
jgi:hypothetical protein